MDNLIIVLNNFINSKLKKLVIKLESGIDENTLLNIGFNKIDGYYIITKDLAVKYLSSSALQKFNEYYEYDRKRNIG